MTTLDGRCLLISLDNIVSPNLVKKIEGEGMPIYNSKSISEEKTVKGDLYIIFDIKFPRNLTENQR